MPFDTDLFLHPSEQRSSSCAIQNMTFAADVPNSALGNNVLHDSARTSFNHGHTYLHEHESDTRCSYTECRYGKNANTHLKPNLVHKSKTFQRPAGHVCTLTAWSATDRVHQLGHILLPVERIFMPIGHLVHLNCLPDLPVALT